MSEKKINYNKLFRQRLRDLAAIRDHKQPKSTPFILPTKEWAIDYHGKYTHAQLHYDYSKIEDIIEHLYSNIPMDAITPGYPGAVSGKLCSNTGRSGTARLVIARISVGQEIFLLL